MNFSDVIIQNLGKISGGQDVESMFAMIGEERELFSALTQSTVEFSGQGVSFTFNEGSILVAAHLFSAGLDKKKEFLGGLPYCIRFGDSRSDVIAKIGTVPSRSGEHSKWRENEVPYWDRFDFDDFILHVQYARTSNRLELVNIMVPWIDDEN